MAIRGTDHYENLSAAGTEQAGPPVRFGDYAVPAAAAWVCKPVDRSPEVRAEFEMRKGEPVCTSITVRSRPGGRPVTTNDLDSLPGLDRKASEAFKALAVRVFDDEAWRKGENLGRSADIFRPPLPDVASALAGRSDDVLQHVATVYRDHFERNPVQAVALALNVSRSTADRRIKEARNRGLLPKTSRGRKKA